METCSIGTRKGSDQRERRSGTNYPVGPGLSNLITPGSMKRTFNVGFGTGSCSLIEAGPAGSLASRCAESRRRSALRRLVEERSRPSERAKVR